MPIPLPDFSSAFDLLTYPNTVLSSTNLIGRPFSPIPDIWYIMILLVIWIISLGFINANARTSRIEESVVAASFLTTIVAILLISATTMSPGVGLVFIVGLALATGILYLRGRE